MSGGRLSAFFCALLVTGCVAAPAGSVDTSVSKVGSNSYQVTLQTDSRAPAAAVWAALTDYDHHAEYVPYLTRSHVVYHAYEYDVVDQEGRFRILFWTFAVQVRQKVRQTPITEFHFQATDGDFTQLEGDWKINPSGAGTHLTCTFVVQPRRRVPGWAVKIAVNRYLAAMVTTMVKKAEKS